MLRLLSLGVIVIGLDHLVSSDGAAEVAKACNAIFNFDNCEVPLYPNGFYYENCPVCIDLGYLGKKCHDAPCAMPSIKFVKKDVCGAAGLSKEYIDSFKKICKCFTPLYNFATSTASDKAASGKAAAVASNLLDATIKGQMCLAQTCDIPLFKNLVCLHTNKAIAKADLKSEHKGDILVQLPVLDPELYISLSVSMGACVVSGSAACQLLMEEIKKYVLSSMDSLSLGLKELRRRLEWYIIEPLDNTAKAIKILGTAITDDALKGLRKCTLKNEGSIDLDQLITGIGANREAAETLLDTIQLIHNAVEFARELDDIRNMTTRLTSGSIDPQLLASIGGLPEKIKELVAGVKAAKQLVPAFKKATSGSNRFDQMISKEIPSLLSNVKDPIHQTSSACKAKLTPDFDQRWSSIL